MQLKVRPLWVRVLLVPVLTWKHRQTGISWLTAFRCARIITKAPYPVSGVPPQQEQG